MPDEKCPKCGAEPSGRSPLTIRDINGKSKPLSAEWRCGSFQWATGEYCITQDCTIAALQQQLAHADAATAELRAENATLKGDLARIKSLCRTGKELNKERDALTVIAGYCEEDETTTPERGE